MRLNGFSPLSVHGSFETRVGENRSTFRYTARYETRIL